MFPKRKNGENSIAGIVLTIAMVAFFVIGGWRLAVETVAAFTGNTGAATATSRPTLIAPEVLSIIDGCIFLNTANDTNDFGLSLQRSNSRDVANCIYVAGYQAVLHPNLTVLSSNAIASVLADCKNRAYQVWEIRDRYHECLTENIQWTMYSYVTVTPPAQ